MTFEKSGDDLEAKIQQKEREIELLKAHIEEGERCAVKLKDSLENFNELGRIINGLYEKAKKLTEEHLRKSEKMPESDEEWRSYDEAAGKIEEIYTLIGRLETESEQVMELISDIERKMAE
jgi:FtsZ-binding cell division protein ZapB